MDGAWAALAIVAVALAANALIHLLAYRATQRYMRAVFLGFGAGLVVFLAGEVVRFVVAPASIVEVLVCLAGDGMLYGCASFLFFNFINAGESAIRVRILHELRGAGRTLSEPELLDLYNDGTIIETRLSRMLGNGQVELVDGHYRLRSRTLVRMAYFFLALKWVLLRRSSEFSH